MVELGDTAVRRDVRSEHYDAVAHYGRNGTVRAIRQRYVVKEVGFAQ